MITKGMQIIRHNLKMDMTFSAYAKRKEELKKIKYRNNNLYDYIKGVLNSRLYSCNELKSLYMSDIFNATQNKTFTEYMEELKSYKTLAEVYDQLIDSIVSYCNDIKIEDIRDCCLIAFTFDNYIGFMMEYIIKETLVQSGFIVEYNKALDDTYKIDILVGHKDSLKAVAIQCKSSTFKRLTDDTKDKYIKGLNRFMNEYKAYEGLKRLDHIHPKFICYNEYNHYCSIDNSTLIDIDKIKGMRGFDIDINHFGYKGLKYNDTADIVVEISNILGVEVPPIQRQYKYI